MKGRPKFKTGDRVRLVDEKRADTIDSSVIYETNDDGIYTILNYYFSSIRHLYFYEIDGGNNWGEDHLKLASKVVFEVKET